MRFHSADYRNAAQLPNGSVLVVGSGQSGSRTLDAHNAVALLLNILAYEVVHAGRCLMEAATEEGWCLRRFREHVLRADARVVVSGRRVTMVIGEAFARFWHGSGRDWSACDTPSRSSRPAKPPTVIPARRRTFRRWSGSSPSRPNHLLWFPKSPSNDRAENEDSPTTNDTTARLASRTTRPNARGLVNKPG